MRSFWKKQVPALLMALVLVLSLMPVAEAAANTIVYDVRPGSSVTLKSSDFADLLDDTDLVYVRFYNPKNLGKCGILATDNANGNDVRVSEPELPAFFVADVREMRKSDYVLSGTYFEALSSAAGETVTIDIEVFGRDSRGTISPRGTAGTLEFRISGGSSTPDVSTANTIFVRTYADDKVTISANEFYEMFRKSSVANKPMNYVIFTAPSNLEDFGHFSAINCKGDRVNLTSSNLNSGRFLYNSRTSTILNDYDLTTLTFHTDRNVKGTLKVPFTILGENLSERVAGMLEISLSSSGSNTNGSSKDTVRYSVKENGTVTFSRRDFRDVFDRVFPRGDFDYMTFTELGKLKYYGDFTAKNKAGVQNTYDETNLDRVWFHYSDIDYDQDCDLDTLTFRADRDVNGVLEMKFTLVGEDPAQKTDGKLILTVGSGKDTTATASIHYDASEEVKFKELDFADYYRKNTSGSLEYVKFIDAKGLENNNGAIYYRYHRFGETMLSPYELGRERIGVDDYYDSEYYISELSFIPGRNFRGPVVLTFRAYGTGDMVEGTLTIGKDDGKKPDNNGVNLVGSGADIRYSSSGMAPVKLQAGDIARYYSKKIPGGTLQSVVLGGVPVEGTVVYNYANKPVTGSSAQMLITAGNVLSTTFYMTPASSSQFSLSELSYVPSRTNYCAAIPFTAYGTGGTVSGTIQISITLNPLSEIYTARKLGTPSIAFPAATVYNTVQKATGLSVAGMRFLALPDATKGALFMNNGTYSLPVSLQSTFGYNSGSWLMNQVSFVPNTGFTGNVELPYAVYDTTGTVFASGVVSIGIVKEDKTFKDMNTGVWCYKYVKELAGNGVIGGYQDGTFKEKNPLTWGAALKLICLANNTGKQGDSFDTFLSLAKAKGWVTGDVNLRKNITRQEFCQVAAKAMGLAVNPAAVSPFTDCKDPYVVALNAAGIIGGYEDGTFLPNKTLTRGHISAIIWRMEQFQR